MSLPSLASTRNCHPVHVRFTYFLQFFTLLSTLATHPLSSFPYSLLFSFLKMWNMAPAERWLDLKWRLPELHYFGETTRYGRRLFWSVGIRGKGIKKVKRQFRERMGEKVDKMEALGKRRLQGSFSIIQTSPCHNPKTTVDLQLVCPLRLPAIASHF